MHAILSVEPSLPSLRVVGGLCLEVSLGTWGLTQFCVNFLRYRPGGHFRSEKNDPEMGQAPTYQARPRDTAHLRPSNVATLSLVEHTLSKFCRDPCTVRRGLVLAVKCYVRKAHFFLCRHRSGMTHHYRRHCSRVPVLFSVFRSHNYL